MMEEVKLTTVPAQIVFADSAIVILTGNNGLTIMITVLEVAGVLMAQVALDVSTQMTASLFTGI